MVTLVVEDGTGSNPNANSYCDLASAVLYMDNRLNTAEWDAADSDTRSQALITATRTIDADCKFRGYKKLATQPLYWPRVKAKNDDLYGPLPWPHTGWLGGYWDENSIPIPLRDATALEALELLRGDRTKDPSIRGLTSFTIPGPLSFTFDQASVPMPLSDEVKRMLTPLITSFRYGGGVRRVTRVQ